MSRVASTKNPDSLQVASNIFTVVVCHFSLVVGQQIATRNVSIEQHRNLKDESVAYLCLEVFERSCEFSFGRQEWR